MYSLPSRKKRFNLLKDYERLIITESEGRFLSNQYLNNGRSLMQKTFGYQTCAFGPHTHLNGGASP